MSSQTQAQATTTDESMGYVYKVSCYESKRHRTSHTDVYYATPQDCQWALDSCDYRRGLIQIHLIQVKQSDMKYKSAHQNRKSQAEPEAAAAEPDVTDVTFDDSALDGALQKDNLDWQFQRPTNGTKYSAVYIYEPVEGDEDSSEDESSSESSSEDSTESSSESEDDELPEALKMVVDAQTVEEPEPEPEAEVEAPPPSTFECCVCMDEQVLSLQYPLPCDHGLCMGCYQEMSKNGCNMTCPCCRGPLDGNRPTAPTSDSLADPEQQELRRILAVEFGQQRPVNGVVMATLRDELRDEISDASCGWSTVVVNPEAFNESTWEASQRKFEEMTNYINNVNTVGAFHRMDNNAIILNCEKHHMECLARGVPFVEMKLNFDISDTSGIDSRGENFAESLARHDRNYERAQEREQASSRDSNDRGLIGVWKKHPPTGRVMIQRRNELADKVWEVARTWPVAAPAPFDHSRYIETRTKLDKMAAFINSATSIHQLNDIEEDFIEQYRKFDIQLQLNTATFPMFHNQVPNQHRHYNRQCCRIHVRAQRPPRQCGLCHETGHNRRSCPSK